jgi:hypothetical protein
MERKTKTMRQKTTAMVTPSIMGNVLHTCGDKRAAFSAPCSWHGERNRRVRTHLVDGVYDHATGAIQHEVKLILPSLHLRKHGADLPAGRAGRHQHQALAAACRRRGGPLPA